MGLNGISGDLGLAVRTCFVFVSMFAAAVVPAGEVGTLAASNLLLLGEVSMVALIDKGVVMAADPVSPGEWLPDLDSSERAAHRVRSRPSDRRHVRRPVHVCADALPVQLRLSCPLPASAGARTVSEMRRDRR